MAHPLVSAEEMRRIDERAIENYGIPSAALMETAGARAAQITWEHFGKPGLRVLVVAGKGKNGGDGFVIARHLQNLGADVRVQALFSPEDASGDSAVFLNILNEMGLPVESILTGEDIPRLRSAAIHSEIVVDAILGTGFTPPARGIVGESLTALSEVKTRVVALDIPSGLDSTTGAATPPHLVSELTITFGAYKRGHFLMPAAGLCGEISLADIGIPRQCVEEENIPLQLVDRGDVAAFLPQRKFDAHKGDAGNLLVVSGSKGMMGAAIMAASAGLRAGAGKGTLAGPENLAYAVESGPPEIMTLSLPATSSGTIDASAFESILETSAAMDAMIVGPGISTHPRTMELVHQLIQHIEIPIVLDADGLNALSQDITALAGMRGGLILTPHPGEMARLNRISVAEVQTDRVSVAIDFAVGHKVHIALKGARTINASPSGNAWLNPTGNPALASGGTGDVLAGVIGALLAQGLSGEKAMVVGTYLHGLAGDIATSQIGGIGLTATDLLPQIPRARACILNIEKGE